MEKKLKDYLHLYLGCVVQSFIYPGGEPKERYNLNSIDEGVLILAEQGWFKPILRPLSDMTEEEKQLAVKEVYGGGTRWNDINDAVDEFDEQHDKYIEFSRYLLPKHFDLFGLIKAGLAIDKTTTI